MESILETLKEIIFQNENNHDIMDFDTDTDLTETLNHDINNEDFNNNSGFISDVKSEYSSSSILSKMQEHDSIAFGEGGYIPDGSRVLERVESHIKETFKIYRYNGHLYVKDGIYKQIDGSTGFVKIHNIDYYKIKK